MLMIETMWEKCVCDWKRHKGKPCLLLVLQGLDGIYISPSLCTQCLFVCCGEREESDMDELELGTR